MSAGPEDGASLRRRFALSRHDALLLVVDVQERLAAAMDPAELARATRYTVALCTAARALGLPVIATEQYPKGLGPTVEAIRAALPPDTAPVEKLAFSCGAVEAAMERIRASGRRQIVVTGMEAHVCVFQTVRDLALAGYQPFVPVDAVLSRTAQNRQVGLDLMRGVGATLTSAEAAIFDLLGGAGTPEFKALSPLLKAP